MDTEWQGACNGSLLYDLATDPPAPATPFQEVWHTPDRVLAFNRCLTDADMLKINVKMAIGPETYWSVHE
jgi:hypothetical protein